MNSPIRTDLALEARELWRQSTLTDYANGYKFTFTLKNETNGNWNVIDGNNNKLNAETDGRINYWTTDANAGWYIFKATDIEVALHELGDASYASLYLPYSISAVSNAEAYVANNAAANNTLVMQTTSDGGFAANQGVVLVSDTKASTATLTLGENTNTSLLSGPLFSLRAQQFFRHRLHPYFQRHSRSHFPESAV